jgi:hypothetical protein
VSDDKITGESFQIDPATNAVVQEFLDNFVTDPVIRLDVEAFLAHAARVNPCVSADHLASLGQINSVYKDLKHQSARKVIRYGANAAVLQILEAYHVIKEQP